MTEMTRDIALSVVIPARNEAQRIGPTLDRVIDQLAPLAAADGVEIIVVDGGSSDGTLDAVAQRVGRAPWLRGLSYRPNRGKGHAVRMGMLAAVGRRRLFTDADLSTPIEELSALMAALDAGADVAIGSRQLDPARVQRRQPRHRQLLGRGFNQLVRWAGLPQYRDTQCGFKLFSATAAEALFGQASVDGFAFDVEILTLARDRFRVVEVPVRWSHDDDSRLRLGRAVLRMAYDVARIRAGLTGRAAGNGHG